jgi:hypothetical protein
MRQLSEQSRAINHVQRRIIEFFAGTLLATGDGRQATKLKAVASQSVSFAAFFSVLRQQGGGVIRFLRARSGSFYLITPSSNQFRQERLTNA